jgi:hypothetical protein
MHRTLPLLVLLGACGPKPDLESAPSWALNWAEVTPTESGIEGFQVWELFVDGWEKKHDQDFFKCRVLQEIDGSLTTCPQAGVPTCYAAYEIELEVTYDDPSIDCSEGLSSDPGWDGPPWMAIGALPPELEGDAPHDEYVLGWYIGYEDGTQLAHGYAYPLSLDDGVEPPGIGWINDMEWVLWPAYVWEL